MTVTWRSASHGPSSTPERTSARGAGTSAAPLAHASHISSMLASNATDRPASTRSSGTTRQSVASPSMNATAARWETATPFGAPVEPEVKMIQASSPGPGRPARPEGSPSHVSSRSAPTAAQTPASLKIRSARATGSSASTGT